MSGHGVGYSDSNAGNLSGMARETRVFDTYSSRKVEEEQ